MASDSPIIVTQGLEMRFRSCHALRGVDLEVMPGTVFALLGENGAGKTTFINLLTGFYEPTAGVCQVNGQSPAQSPEAVRRQMGYVPDDPPLYGWMSPAQMGSLAASFYGGDYRQKFQASMRRYGVDLNQKIKRLSKGQRAKVALSLAVSHDPALLILDEPTSGLDPKVRRDFLESMIDRAGDGQTVFLSSHQISEVERVADSIAILHEGRIVLNGSLQEVRESVTRIEVDFEAADHEIASGIASSDFPWEILLEERQRRGCRWFVRHYEPEMAPKIKEMPGVMDVQAHPASLEEVFVACTQHAKTIDGVDCDRTDPDPSSKEAA